MFSINHIIWLVICTLLIVISVRYINKNNVSLDKLLTAACVICVISEVIKVFTMMELVPSSDGSQMYVYLKPQHLPFHLCSIQIVMIFFVKFAEKGMLRTAVLAFMYPTCIVGAVLALIMTSIFQGTIEPSQAFMHPLAYQYFLYHTMLLILGISIHTTKQVEIDKKHYFSTIGLLGALGFISVYLNSMLAMPTYANGEIVSVDYIPNFFFTYKLPFPIYFNEIWQWYLYIGGIAVIAVIVIAVFYIPYFRKKDK